MLVVKKSKIHGLGLFAGSNFPAGAVITEFLGVKMPMATFVRRYGNDWKFVYKARDYVIVAKEEPWRSNNLINYVNEGAVPNVMLKKRKLIALRPIKKGEEFLLRYHKEYNRTYAV